MTSPHPAGFSRHPRSALRAQGNEQPQAAPYARKAGALAARHALAGPTVCYALDLPYGSAPPWAPHAPPPRHA